MEISVKISQEVKNWFTMRCSYILLQRYLLTHVHCPSIHNTLEIENNLDIYQLKNG